MAGSAGSTLLNHFGLSDRSFQKCSNSFLASSWLNFFARRNRNRKAKSEHKPEKNFSAYIFVLNSTPCSASMLHCILNGLHKQCLFYFQNADCTCIALLLHYTELDRLNKMLCFFGLQFVLIKLHCKEL